MNKKLLLVAVMALVAGTLADAKCRSCNRNNNRPQPRRVVKQTPAKNNNECTTCPRR